MFTVVGLDYSCATVNMYNIYMTYMYLFFQLIHQFIRFLNELNKCSMYIFTGSVACVQVPIHDN